MTDNLIQEPKVIQVIIQELNKLTEKESKKRVLDYVYNAFDIVNTSKVNSGISGGGPPRDVTDEKSQQYFGKTNNHLITTKNLL